MNSLAERIYDEVKDSLDRDYVLGLGDLVEEAIDSFLNNLPEADRKKIVSGIVKGIKAREKEQKQRERELERKNRTVWKLTKGKIPCLGQCGKTFSRTREEVISGSNSIICKDCYEGRGIDGKPDSIYDMLKVQ